MRETELFQVVCKDSFVFFYLTSHCLLQTAMRCDFTLFLFVLFFIREIMKFVRELDLKC